MSIAFVQQKAEQSTTSVSSFTTSALTVTAGNALAVCTSGNNADTIVVTDSKSDAFSDESTTTGTLMQVNWALATNAVGGSTTFTATPATSQFVSICIHEYSGVALAPIETSGGQEGISQTPTCGALLPPSAGDLYLSAWTHNGFGNETFTPDAGWTLRSNLTVTANQPLGSEELIGSGVQEGRATLSGSASPHWLCVGMALRSADVAAPDDGNSPNFVVDSFPMTSRGFGSEG